LVVVVVCVGSLKRSIVTDFRTRVKFNTNCVVHSCRRMPHCHRGWPLYPPQPQHWTVRNMVRFDLCVCALACMCMCCVFGARVRFFARARVRTEASIGVYNTVHDLFFVSACWFVLRFVLLPVQAHVCSPVIFVLF
jgi:hypothetical protein